MKKKNVLNLIKYHSEGNNTAFRNEAYEIARYFDKVGDYQLAEYIMALMSDANLYVPQEYYNDLTYLQKVNIDNTSLLLPDSIKEDMIGIINAVNHNVGINKFIFEGTPGTGKTETVKHIARITEKDLLSVNFENIIDSKMGQTSKNIMALFNEINNLNHPEKTLILFDEIDAIAMNRIDSNDLREMGRATSTILKGLDTLNDKIVIIATTNLFNAFDKALTRRFDSIINFDRYSREDLLIISESILNFYLQKFKNAGKNIRLFRKIISLMVDIYYPGEMKNLIKTSLAFSNPNSEYDYLRRLYLTIKNSSEIDIRTLREEKFTLREIEVLTGISRSSISREEQGW